MGDILLNKMIMKNDITTVLLFSMFHIHIHGLCLKPDIVIYTLHKRDQSIHILALMKI